MKTSRFSPKFVAVSVLVGLTASLGTAAPQTGEAKVTGVKGSAMVGDQPAKVNVQVPPGALLTTGTESQLDLYLGLNGPTVRLMADSRLSIDELTYDSAGAEPVVSTRLGLKQGKVAGHVKKTSDQSTYKVETPTATASIRGTKYLISAEGNVYVFEGCVDVAFRGISYNVCGNQSFDPAIPGVVDNPIPVYPGRPGTPDEQAPGDSEIRDQIRPVGPRLNLSPIAPGRGPTGGPVGE